MIELINNVVGNDQESTDKELIAFFIERGIDNVDAEIAVKVYRDKFFTNPMFKIESLYNV